MVSDRDTAGSAAPQAKRLSKLAEWFVAAPLPARARVLALGRDAAPLAGALRTRGMEVVDGDAAMLARTPDDPTFDAAIAVGFVEHERWDRWTLQRLHATLRPDGVLLLATPNLYRWRALLSPAYVAEKVAKKLSTNGALPRAAGPGPSGFRGYTPGRVTTMLETLGFSIARDRGSAPVAEAWMPTALRSVAFVLARRGPSVFGLDPGRPFPAAASHRAQFARRHARHLRVRDESLRGRPSPAAPVASALEPERYAGRPLLVLAPHPDDELIGCGGTLLRLARAGARITVLHATDGSASAALDGATERARRSVRVGEAEAVARAAGLSTIVWGEDNRVFVATRDLVARLRETLRTLSPALIFAPFPTDDHPDHRTVNRLLAAALAGETLPETEVIGYEVWGLVAANRYCDVTRETSDVNRLLFLYETAMQVDDFVHLRADRGYYHAITHTGRPGFAEAFVAETPDAYRSLVEHLLR